MANTENRQISNEGVYDVTMDGCYVNHITDLLEKDIEDAKLTDDLERTRKGLMALAQLHRLIKDTQNGG